MLVFSFMTANIDERIGKVIWPALRASRGEAAIESLLPLIERFPPGGVIVFGEGAEDVAALIARLRLRVGHNLLVAADLERGCGQHVREFSSLPPAMAIAACTEPDAARHAGLLTAIEARQAGIDVVFAPVADVNTADTNPIIATRSFGDDPYHVAALSSAFARGLAEGGVLAVAKHFPGHGSTVQDSHSVLARVQRSLEEIEAIDLVPFRTLIAEDVGGIMVGHLEVPGLDRVPGRPATTSPTIILDWLRDRLGFNGLVVTDALDMGGFPQEEAAALDVLQAGLDVLLMPSDPLATAVALRAAYDRGHLPDEVLDAAVTHIDAAGTRIGRAAPDGRRPPPDLADRLLSGSLTLQGPPLPPLTVGSPVLVESYGDDTSGIVVGAFNETLEAAGMVLGPGGPRIGLVLTSVRAHLGTSRLPDLQRRRLQWALENGQLDGVVVLGSPYELLDLPAEVPGLLAYEASPAAAAAAARVLLGESSATGRLPVGMAP